ncbi:MAG: hypothetical protein JXQ82_07800 [Methanomicrobiaceae archaeon]|nr:hypothetical protein [Methanomicrobiaceae archaeon]
MEISDVIFQTMDEVKKIPIIKEIVPIGTAIGVCFLCKEAAAQLNLLASIIDIVGNANFLDNDLLKAAGILVIVVYLLNKIR